MTTDRYVATRAAQTAVKGRETDVLKALGIPWEDGAPHISCPYPGHADAHPSWRWSEPKARAYCTCTDRRGHSIFDVVMQVDGIEFEAAKLRVAELLGRHDLIKARDGERHQAMDAASLLRPPTDQREDHLERAYLAFRLGVGHDEAPMPSTPVAGWRGLAYYDPPAKKGGKPKLVGHYPCVVFGTLAPNGRRHAHRIYVAAAGQGKAELGTRSDGRARDPKKSAKLRDGQSAAGCAVPWGDPATSPHLVLAEGIETAAALALVHRSELETNELAIAAALSASGISSFEPWPATKRVTVAADRDEGRPADDRGYRAGERAAREFALRHHEQLEVQIALPGEPGENVDWLDILRRDGAAVVRAGIEGAERFSPTPEEIEGAKHSASHAAELAEIERTYPLPAMESLTLAYRRTPSGRIMVHTYAGRNEEGEIWLPVSTPFGVPARLRYADCADSYGLRVAVQDMDGRPRHVDFDRAEMARMGAAEARARLFAAGLRTEVEGEAAVLQALKAADPPAEVVVVSRPGWHWLEALPDPVFVTPAGEALGLPAGRAIDLASAARIAGALAAGTLDGWRQSVGAAVGEVACPHWILGTVAAFAGPVLALTGLDTCGINLSGLSSSGKTTAQRLAASAWGSPTVGAGLLQSMRTTDNALESLSQTSSGTVLALDELAHVEGRVLGRMIYSLAGGLGKARMTSGAALRGRYGWSTFLLLSGECSLEEKVRGDGGTWTAGAAARIADVDVTGVNRHVGRDALETINGIRHHFGHAGPAFVRALIADGAHEAPDALRTRLLEAALRIARDGSDSARARAALPFALLFVAGELARSFELLPADCQVLEAVRWAWERFVGSSDAAALSPDEQVLNQLRTWIAERWDVTIKSVEASWENFEAKRLNNRESVAWYDDDAVYLPTRRVREATAGVLKEQHVARLLSSRDLLARREKERLTVRYVPKIGHVQCYALRRSEFGRTSADRPEFAVYEGGQP